MTNTRFNLSTIAISLGLFIVAVFFLIFITGQSPVRTVGVVPIFELPASLSFCGEPVPLERQDVREMLDREFVISVYDHAQVIMWMKRANRYFPYIEKRLKERNMPDDLKYVVIVESALKTYAFSGAGAAGPWQFMEKTAKGYGLRVDDWIDERLNFERATEAALDYFGDLYKKFGSWTVAVAAYNCGEDRMNRDITGQNVNNFYGLNLPLETERYIFRGLAAKVILSAPELYGYNVPEKSLYPPLEYDRLDFKASGEVHLRNIASACGTTFKAVKEINPQIRNSTIPAGCYALNVPKGTAEQFKANFASALSRDKRDNILICKKKDRDK